MKKKGLVLAALLVITSSKIYCENRVLNSPIIYLIDGKPYALNGHVFGLLLQVRKQVREIVYGVKKQDGSIEGPYTFDGKRVTLTDLVELELALDTESEGYAEARAKLNEMLNTVKEDFLEITKSYVNSIRGFKEQILKLIEESCDLRGKEECFLLRWGEEMEESEGETLRREIVTLEQFRDFCSDLADFLEDMARSCPEAKKLFIKMIKG